MAAMDQIYSSAALTIAATTGDNASTRLDGISAGPRTFQQYISKAQGMYLADRPLNFDIAVNDSVWNTRAWTLQQRVMSPTTLFVANQRCFFSYRCRQDAFIQSDNSIENAPIRRFNLAKNDLPIDQMGNLTQPSPYINVISYRRLVKIYTSRHLTFPSDILEVFGGIEALFRPLFRSDFIFGLPRSEVDSQLLWKPAGPMVRRRDSEIGLPIFPS